MRVYRVKIDVNPVLEFEIKTYEIEVSASEPHTAVHRAMMIFRERAGKVFRMPIEDMSVGVKFVGWTNGNETNYKPEFERC